MTSFSSLHHGADPLLLPNAWDHASAAAFAAAGFPAVGTTSLGVAAANGILDGAGAAREETVALAIALTGGDWLVSADIEGGFSDDPAEVAELCRRLADAGVAGVNLEDGLADGSLRPAALHAEIVAAVKAACPELFVNARTDTAWLGAGDLDATIARVRGYEDAGADGLFVPGLGTAGEIARVVGAVTAPVNVLLSPTGPTVAQLGELGVARVSCGSLLFRVALAGAVDALAAVAAGEPVAARAMGYDEVQALVPAG